MSQSNPIMLFKVQIWSETLKEEKYRHRLASVQCRGALRVVCAYRMVSKDA